MILLLDLILVMFFNYHCLKCCIKVSVKVMCVYVYNVLKMANYFTINHKISDKTIDIHTYS